MNKDLSGPAFPSTPSIGPNDQLYRPVDIGCEGLSMRDYFAAKAMQGLLATGEADKVLAESDQDWCEAIAGDSYGMADAMLKARE